jgi:hypothetical protein
MELGNARVKFAVKEFEDTKKDLRDLNSKYSLLQGEYEAKNS